MRRYGYILIILALTGLWLVSSSLASKGMLSKGPKWSDRADRVLVVVPSYGFGNRMRALASGMALAEFTNRELWICWPHKYFPVDYQAVIQEPFRLVSESQLAADALKLPGFRSINMNFLLHEDEVAVLNDSAEVIVISSHSRFKDVAQVPREFRSQYRKQFRSIRLVDDIEHRVEQFIAKNELVTERDIGVHYRGWTRAVGDKENQPVADLEEFFLEMDKAPASAKFLLATDKLSVVKRFRDRFGDRIVHAGLSSVSRKGQGILDAVFEWKLLASTRYVIGTYESSFSDTAAELTFEGRKISVGPEVYREQRELG